MMNVFELTRAIVDMESTTGMERSVGDFLFGRLSVLAVAHGGRVERMKVEAERNNIFVAFGEPIVTLSTHMDTVPPFFASSEDDDFIHGRGSCDAKGILAAMIAAAESLLAGGTRNFGLLFVVGEERNSLGAKAAAASPRGSKFLINGEPTGNRLAIGSKGALRFELVATGKLAHSAYPELGDSAVHRLLEALAEIRAQELPVDPVLGNSTLNVGLISGGRAPNVIADAASAEIMFRTVGDPAPLRELVARAAARSRIAAREILYTPAAHLASLPGFATSVVAFTTDIPTFNGAWGQPFLVGPGSIHVAHTLEERIPKKELTEAVEIYARMVRQLATDGMAAAS